MLPLLLRRLGSEKEEGKLILSNIPVQREGRERRRRPSPGGFGMDGPFKRLEDGTAQNRQTEIHPEKKRHKAVESLKNHLLVFSGIIGA